MNVHSMKELHNKYVIMTNYHYLKHGIIIKTDTTITLIQFVSYKWDSIIKTMESELCQISGTEQQNINTIKPYKITKRGGVKSGKQ